MGSKTYGSIRDTLRLANGVEIPRMGLGVFQVDSKEELETAVKAAFENGYLHIDTAEGYNNEDMVGTAIKKFGRREDVFITSKLDNPLQDDVEKAFDDTLRKLGTDYLDLFLIHWPSPWRGLYVKAWERLVKLYETGRVRAIGVSNFNSEHIEAIYDATGIMPVVNQVERHPLFQQGKLMDWCAQHNIAMEAYAPLTSGSLDKLIPALQPLADQKGKTVAQIILRWQFQSNWIFIPKSIHPARVAENADIFDFELTDEDMKALAALDAGKRLFPDPLTANF